MSGTGLMLMDERDDSLAQLYIRSSREEPPAQIDLAVMELARKSVRRRAGPPVGKRWLAAGAAAGVALVGVTLVLLVQEQTSLTAPPQATRRTVPMVVPDAGRERDSQGVTISLPLPPPGRMQDNDQDPVRRSAPAEREAPQPRSAQTGQAQERPGGTPAADQPREPGSRQPRFDFYKTLPEMQLVVPPPSEPVAGQATAPQPVPEPAVAGRPPQAAVHATEPAAARAAPATGYYLQVGAFRAADSAGRFRTRIQSLGLPAGIEDIVLDNQETWHRVRVGPYHDQTGLDEARRTLKAQGIDSLLVKTGG
jgi:cell division protein FtsN